VFEIVQLELVAAATNLKRISELRSRGIGSRQMLPRYQLSSNNGKQHGSRLFFML